MSLRFKLAFETKAPDFSIASEDSQDKTLDECGQHLDDAEKALEQINQFKDILSTASDKLTVAEESFFVMGLNKLRFDLGVENYELSTESFKSSKTLALESLEKIGNAIKQAVIKLLKKIKEIIVHLMRSGLARKSSARAKVSWLRSRLDGVKDIINHMNDNIEVHGLQRLSIDNKNVPKNFHDILRNVMEVKKYIVTTNANCEKMLDRVSKSASNKFSDFKEVMDMWSATSEKNESNKKFSYQDLDGEDVYKIKRATVADVVAGIDVFSQNIIDTDEFATNISKRLSSLNKIITDLEGMNLERYTTEDYLVVDETSIYRVLTKLSHREENLLTTVRQYINGHDLLVSYLQLSLTDGVVEPVVLDK